MSAGRGQPIAEFLRELGALSEEQTAALVAEFEDMEVASVGDAKQHLPEQSDLELFVDDAAALAAIWAAFQVAWGGPAAGGRPAAGGGGGGGDPRQQPIAAFLRAVGVLDKAKTAALVAEFADMEAEQVGDAEELMPEKSDLELFVSDDPLALETIWTALEVACERATASSRSLPFAARPRCWLRGFLCRP